MSRNCYRLLILIVAFILTTSVNAQHNSICSEFYRLIKLSSSNINNIKYKSINMNGYEAISTNINIPIVVHILYHTANENIPDSIIHKMIDVLNEDFGRYNSDTANTPAPFQPVASATGIQFCLAQQDTNGNAINGIEHIYTPTVQFTYPEDMKDPLLGGLRPWNTDQYFNIWIGNSQFTESAFAIPIFPAYHSNFGLVIDQLYINISAMGTYYGRAVTHGMGHCFNLLHPWDFNVCAETDSVSDTPTGIFTTDPCFTFPSYVCNTSFPGDMFMNFMYGLADESCQNMFTIEQGIRMVNSLNTYYPLLVNSTVCNPPTGVTGINQANKIQIFPNPASDFINIYMNDIPNSHLIIEMVDELGRKYFSKKITSSSEKIELSNIIQSGFYHIYISEEEKIIYRSKLLIQR